MLDLNVAQWRRVEEIYEALAGTRSREA